MKNQAVIKKEAILGIVDTVKDGEFVSITFDRVAPKCVKCGKSNKKWASFDFCPECGGALSKERFTMAQFGVAHSQNAPTPNGNGESGEEAKAKGRLKFFDMNAENNDGTKGNYRQCRIDTIKRMTVKGTEYIIDRSND